MRARIAVIGHHFVNALNRDKFEWAARDGDLDLHVVVPHRWVGSLEEHYSPVATGPGPGGSPALHPIRVRFEGVNQMHRYAFGIDLWRALRTIAPDLIHIAEEPYSVAALQVALAAAALGRPRLVLTSYQNVVHRYPLPVRLAQRFVLGSVTRAVAGTSQVEAALRRKGLACPIERIGYGADLRLFRPPADREAAKRALGLSGRVVGYVGRLVPTKGLDTLLWAMRPLAPGATLLVVGTGPDEGRLRSLAGAMRLSDRVHWAGRVAHDAVWRHMQAMDLMVVPSRDRPGFSEQFGRVLVEAMACGVPVLGSDAGGIPEVVGRTGRLFPQGDPWALRSQIAAILKSPRLSQELSRAGLARSRDELSNEAVGRRLAAMYRRALVEPSTDQAPAVSRAEVDVSRGSPV